MGGADVEAFDFAGVGCEGAEGDGAGGFGVFAGDQQALVGAGEGGEFGFEVLEIGGEAEGIPVLAPESADDFEFGFGVCREVGFGVCFDEGSVGEC